MIPGAVEKQLTKRVILYSIETGMVLTNYILNHMQGFETLKKFARDHQLALIEVRKRMESEK